MKKESKHISMRIRGLATLIGARVFQKGKISFHPYRSYFARNVRVSLPEPKGMLSLRQITICDNCYFEACGELTIGNGTFFNRNCMVVSKDKITIGDNCSFGPNVCIYDHDHAFDENGQIRGQFKCSEVVIGDNVWVGAGTVILCGSHIGENCVIGAGTAIKEEISPNTLVVSASELKQIPLRASK